MLAARIGLLLLVAGASTPAAGESWLVDLQLWLNGEARDTAPLIIEVGQPASVSWIDEQDQSGWRLDLAIEQPLSDEGAPAGAIWLHVGIFERDDGEWTLLTDSMLGVPAGQEGVLSVVDQDVEHATPDNSQIYLKTRISRLQPSAVDD